MKHILLDFPGFNASRKLFNEVRSLRDFSKILPEKIVVFYHVLIKKKSCIVLFTVFSFQFIIYL